MAVPSMHVLGGVALAGGATFDPVTAFTWHSLFWAEGPDFVAQGYANGANVTNWPNETTEQNASNSTFSPSPTYVASEAAFNGQPAVDFTGGLKKTAAFTANPTYPLSIVCVVLTDAPATRQLAFDGLNAGSRNNFEYYTTKYGIYAGSADTVGSTTATTDPLFVRCLFDGSTGADKLYINESLEVNSNVGSNKIAGISLGGSDLIGGLNGRMALVGLYQGDISGDGSWSALKTWVTAHYGITLA